MKIIKITGAILVTAWVLTGCAPVISEEVRSTIDETISVLEVIENPSAFTGSRVLWAGIVIDTKAFKDHTIVEVLQKPADYQGRPKTVDVSQGRFLARYNGFLDPAVYTSGREVTIAGEIAGTKVSTIGEYAYTYPVVLITEIHLWPVESEKEYHYFYYPTYYHDRWRYW
ncbi:MAG TPA: Slp family lipoprotein [Deltaproteobacteria bacterium]|nr:Slp family lipoprotein [Deltaproteobacteria bacterium]HPJ93585.1 Slp family lipoprotein [Deltaproteobacteria bacterium]HPR51306.1 Slp family lipoprotein [Deltaproteobacteria bacterium]